MTTEYDDIVKTLKDAGYIAKDITETAQAAKNAGLSTQQLIKNLQSFNQCLNSAQQTNFSKKSPQDSTASSPSESPTEMTKKSTD